MKRFFISKDDISNNQIILNGEEHNHLSKVLRLKPNDEVECFYNDSPVFVCKILEITKNYSKLEIVSEEECLQNPKTNLTLFQALPKQDKLETVCQKLTELGVKRVVPFKSSFCIAKENENKIERINKIIVSACKQCGRTNLLKVEKVFSFSEMLKELEKFDKVVFACEFAEKSQDNLLKTLSGHNMQNKPVAYIIGSEGGFSKDEAEKISKLQNVLTINLGKRILRTETASVALASILQSILEEF